jgi:hypothetical protein
MPTRRIEKHKRLHIEIAALETNHIGKHPKREYATLHTHY